jgi:2-polyprenyl-3-methyl-5-hydroxy-6-metoxy-1,4-benzoquinol methylase
LSEIYQYSTTNRKELVEFFPKNYKRVLEVGCGTGGFRDTLKKDIEIWGIEPNKEAANEAMTRGYKVLVGFYEEVAEQCPNNYFDLIVCNDVIEHMLEHEKFLEIIKLKMTPDASIIGSIPNVRYFGNLCKLLLNKDWKYVDNGVLDRTHLRFFTEKSLKRTFANTKYKIEKLSGIQSDFTKWNSFFMCIRNFILLLITIATFGHSKDIQYVQFAFRLKNSV